MLISNCLIVLILAAGWIKAEEELVWLEDVNNGNEGRHLDLGLPENIEFYLNRRGGKSLRLTLTENKRLNANAPVYETVSEHGKQRMVQRAAVPILTTKFYHDKEMGAALKVTCSNFPYCATQRSLEGSLNIDGDTYEIQPEPQVHVARSQEASTYAPHTITKVSAPTRADTDQEGRGFPGADFKYINNEIERIYDDGKPIPDDENTRSYDDGKVTDEPSSKLAQVLRFFLHIRELDSTAEKILSNTHRQKRASQLLAVEIVAVVDPILWENYSKKTKANNGLNQEQATEFVIRQKLAHVINGVSLRYESIDDPTFRMYVTISKFLFYKTISNGNPLSPSVPTYTIDGKKLADSDVYIDNLDEWALTLQGLSHDDHIMVFSGYELYYGGNTTQTEVLGVAYVSGACGRYRVSVQQDGHYFQLTSVAAHELGHNLGMEHDGFGSSSNCSKDGTYLMAEYAASFSPGEAYSINPWRFSQCSIDALKAFIKSATCLTDAGDYYNKAEWDLHNSKLPGEIYSLDKQCKLIKGDDSGHCSDSQSNTSEEVCQTMMCKDDVGCTNYAAARGTSCGQTSENKWCIDGACVKRTVVVTTSKAPTTTTTTTKAPQTTTTTQAPQTTTTTQAPSTTTTTQAPQTTTTQAPSTTTTTQAPQTTTTQAPTLTTTTQASKTTTSTQSPTTTTTTTTTTQAPTTPTATQEGTATTMSDEPTSATNVYCFDYDRQDCQILFDIFKDYSWCAEPYWAEDCCAFCNDPNSLQNQLNNLHQYSQMFTCNCIFLEQSIFRKKISRINFVKFSDINKFSKPRISFLKIRKSFPYVNEYHFCLAYLHNILCKVIPCIWKEKLYEQGIKLE